MTTLRSPRKIAFPRIGRVSLSNFDIYSIQPNAEVEVKNKVFCLIGANGLGKSTFLNSINFAVTGAVPDPGRKFLSAKDYLANCARPDRTEEYFSGRISEANRSLASVTVELIWSEKTIEVTREIFGGSRVTQFLIKSEGSDSDKKVLLDENTTADELKKAYESQVLALTGLDEFAQFVFLLHFVATFDEGRHLLMWDDTALTNALYLAFGADPAEAFEADHLQREMERESSLGRNVRYAARHLTDRIDQLVDILKGQEPVDHISTVELQAQHDRLQSIFDESKERVRRKESELRDTDLKWTDFSSLLTEAQLEYRKLFSSRLRNSTSVEHHPIIRATLSENKCSLCSTSDVADHIKTKLEKHFCPLCDSKTAASPPDDDSIIKLRQIDEKITQVKENLTETLSARERLNAELNSAQAAHSASANELREFEQKKAAELAKINGGGDFSAIRQEMSKLEMEREEFLSKSRLHYQRRDRIREKLRTYERNLKIKYEKAAETFVPRFRRLAEEFIGLPVDVELEHRQGANDSGFGLRLRMNEQLRLTPDKLSESQRFFIDIALRMALSEFMAVDSSSLLIDTPEGSLDIAYEARAGSMFAEYVKNDNWILMTANLRSSELVLRLAKLEGKSGMQIVKMTDWTDLSEVQQSEEALFSKAYDTIQEALV